MVLREVHKVRSKPSRTSCILIAGAFALAAYTWTVWVLLKKGLIAMSSFSAKGTNSSVGIAVRCQTLRPLAMPWPIVPEGVNDPADLGFRAFIKCCNPRRQLRLLSNFGFTQRLSTT